MTLNLETKTKTSRKQSKYPKTSKAIQTNWLRTSLPRDAGTFRNHRNLIFCNTSNKITTFCFSWPSFFLTFQVSIPDSFFHQFYQILDPKRLPKSTLFQHNSSKKATLSYPASPVDASFFGHRFWDAFWSPFGSLLAPFFNIKNRYWSLWLHFIRFWLPFGSILVPLAPF